MDKNDRVATALVVLQHVFDSMDTATLVRTGDGPSRRLDDLVVRRLRGLLAHLRNSTELTPRFTSESIQFQLERDPITGPRLALQEMVAYFRAASIPVERLHIVKSLVADMTDQIRVLDELLKERRVAEYTTLAASEPGLPDVVVVDAAAQGLGSSGQEQNAPVEGGDIVLGKPLVGHERELVGDLPVGGKATSEHKGDEELVSVIVELQLPKALADVVRPFLHVVPPAVRPAIKLGQIDRHPMQHLFGVGQHHLPSVASATAEKGGA